MGRAALVAALGLVLATSVAAAAPPWSAPENVSSPATFIDSPHVVFDGLGRVYATWIWSGPAAGKQTPAGWRIAVRERGAAKFGPERSAPNLVTPPVTFGINGVLGLDRPNRSRGRVALRARLAGPDARFGRPDTISVYEPAPGFPSLAAHGHALAAWIERGRRGRHIVRAATRRGRRFGRPVILRSRGRARDVVAGAGPGVDFVAWERAGIVEGRVRRALGRWGPVRRLGDAERASNTFRAAFGGPRAYLVWLAERGGEFATLRVAVLPAGGTRFRGAQTVDTVDGPVPPEPHAPAIVAVSEREALLAWTDRVSPTWRVRAAVTGPGARFGAPFDVSPPGEQAVLGGAASILLGTLPAGTAMLVWSRLDAPVEVGDRVRAAIRPPGGSFGPPEDVSDLDRARVPTVAYDFVAQRWTAVWSQRIGPDQGVPLNQITTFLGAANRPG